MDAQVLIARLRKAREEKVELGEGGKAVTIRRPPEFEQLQLTDVQRIDAVERYVVGWSGFTEDDFLGNACRDPVDFDPALWREYAADRIDVLTKVWAAIVEACNRHANTRAHLLGN